ncbi:KUP system potassium uptake protein [Sporothrix brasiliensis 5110]|uniref:KUP system potassium uptake protein n=1 Tax=Sporothrix brasiliensis 5110 TaxID=1398154 RepID=A0A0C2FQV3_9PEZI|nr:KUP system potassium uptake protein [Sporothrix brasiliensis 5110]KIH93423.1 KUP system potassium uptake protein [Sporothrix brasiliensis 5110]
MASTDSGPSGSSLPDKAAVWQADSVVIDRHDDDDAAAELGKFDGDLAHSRKQTFSGFVLLWLGFQSCGPSWDDLVGALSIVLWSLTLIVSVKYVCIVLAADDDGQGGTFALYSLLARYVRLARGGGGSTLTPHLQRYRTGDMRPGARGLRRLLEGSAACQRLLQLAGVLGVSMVMADGVLTPAQSVLGAIQGLTVVRPDLGTPAIVGITCAVLVVLFLLQPLGTARLGSAFAPIVVVWLLFNLASGVYNLAVHDHTVLRAASPHYAVLYLVRNGTDGWRSLGGLLLAFTGVEALFADLAAFGRRAIQLSWLCLAFPCLLFAYAGQAAFIAQDATGTAFVGTNPFYNTVPPGTFYFSMVIAILAAVVASQAMVTSTFQLLVQVMRLSYFPHVKVVHTSRRFHDQVYVPLANWLLMVGTVVVTAVYNNTTSLGNAYGVCVVFVTFLTTCMLALVALLIWRLPVYVVLPVFLLFALLDGTYLSAVLTKVPAGAWFTLLLALVLSSVFVLWRFGKEAQWAAEARHQAALAAHDAAAAPSPPPPPTSVVPGLGIFFDKLGDPARPPPCFTHFVLKFAARPAVILFFHMRPLDVPVVTAPDERFVVARHRHPSLARSSTNAYLVVLRHGYAEEPLHPGIAHDLVAQVDGFLARSLGRTPPENVPRVEQERAALRAASATQIVYLLGKEAMRVGRRSADGDKEKDKDAARGTRKPTWRQRLNVWLPCRRLLLELFLWIRENSRTKLAAFDMEIDKMVEVGYLTEL